MIKFIGYHGQYSIEVVYRTYTEGAREMLAGVDIKSVKDISSGDIVSGENLNPNLYGALVNYCADKLESELN